MTPEAPKPRVPPSTREILRRQAADAERARLQRRPAYAKAPEGGPAAAKPAIAPAPTTAVAVPDTRPFQEQYLDAIAPAAIVGRLIKFGKDGTFITADDGEPVGEETDFIALCDQTLIGWLRFHEDGQPPDRVMGLLYGGFVMPPREQLGDTDEGKWSAGLSGAPQDPWQHTIYLVLQKSDTAELFTFATSSMTGRRAVGNLLRHYDRTRRKHADELPVVRLKPGGYHHKDERIGWVATPTFSVVGRAASDSVAKPDTSIQAQLDDQIPFN